MLEPTRQRRSSANYRPFGFEILEQRALLAVGFEAPTGALLVAGGEANDSIEVFLTFVPVPNCIPVCPSEETRFVEVIINGREHSSAPASSAFDPALAGATDRTVHSILVEGHGGVDRIALADGFTLADGQITLDGGDGPDRITGSSQSEVILGGSGNDTIRGGAGDDTLRGQEGRDVIWGQGGNDSIRGGRGGDNLFGGDGNHVLQGRRSSDTLEGGDGNDTLRGGRGKDSLDGGSGDDGVEGDAGDDLVLGGDGNDLLFGGEGDDEIQGGAGNDTIQGGVGSDLVLAGPGEDQVNALTQWDGTRGGQDRDTIRGEYGDDTIYGSFFTDDSIDGGEGDDTLQSTGIRFGNPPAFPFEYPSLGNDSFRGGPGSDLFIVEDEFLAHISDLTSEDTVQGPPMPY